MWINWTVKLRIGLNWQVLALPWPNLTHLQSVHYPLIPSHPLPDTKGAKEIPGPVAFCAKVDGATALVFATVNNHIKPVQALVILQVSLRPWVLEVYSVFPF